LTVAALGLPVFIYVIHVAIHFWDWNLLIVDNWLSLLRADTWARTWAAFAPNAYTWTLSLGWCAFHAVLYMLAPGRIVKVSESRRFKQNAPF
jgi:hypothetical protein